MCVCVRERERERRGEIDQLSYGGAELQAVQSARSVPLARVSALIGCRETAVRLF